MIADTYAYTAHEDDEYPQLIAAIAAARTKAETEATS